MGIIIETASAIDILALLLLLLVLLRRILNYCYCYWYCQEDFPTIAIDIDIAKRHLKLLLITSYFHFESVSGFSFYS